MAPSIDINANTRAAQANIKDLSKALDETSDALDDVARDAGKSGDKLEASFRDMVRASEKAGREIGKNLKDEPKRALNDLKDEARDSGREAAASFSGEFGDVTDFIQETVANGLGPAGVAGGVLIGAVTATAMAAVEAWNEQVQGIKDATASMWQEAASEGQSFLDASAIQAEAHRNLWDEAYQAQLDAAEKAGVKRADLAVALATGEGEAFDRVHKQIMDARAEEQAAARDAVLASQDGNVALQDTAALVNSELAKTVTLLEEKAKATDDSKRKTREAAEATAILYAEERDQIKRTADAATARYEAMAKHYGQPIKTAIEVDSRSLDIAERRLAAFQERASRGVGVILRPGEGRTWE